MVVVSALFAGSHIFAPDARAQAREIKIGGTMAVTGVFSVEWGPTAKNFMEEWAKMMNERGGVFVKEANAKHSLSSDSRACTSPSGH
jgi:hypothetical protein